MSEGRSIVIWCESDSTSTTIDESIPLSQEYRLMICGGDLITVRWLSTYSLPPASIDYALTIIQYYRDEAEKPNVTRHQILDSVGI